MMKKKVLYLITKSTWGGAQQYVYDLATNIDKEVYEPIIALGGKDRLYDELKEAGLQVISIRGLGRDVSLIKDIQATLHVAYILIKIRPDILHINSSKVGVIGTLMGRILFLPKVLFTSHGWAFNEDRSNLQKFIIKILHWLTVLLSHKTIVVSHGLKKDLNWPFVQNKMHIIHLGRDVAHLKSREDARGTLVTKVQHNQNSLYDYVNDFWIGTIAELHPTKCVNIAIDAVAQLVTTYPTLRYVIIHDGQERQALEDQVKNLQLENNVFFTGTIKNAANLLTAFDLCILPSRSEAFGYVLIEAGQAKVPVVASNVGGIPDIIINKETGLLVEPCNSSELKEAIGLLIDDVEQREQLAKAHYERSTTFTLKKMIGETEAVYEAN